MSSKQNIMIVDDEESITGVPFAEDDLPRLEAAELRGLLERLQLSRKQIAEQAAFFQGSHCRQARRARMERA